MASEVYSFGTLLTGPIYLSATRIEAVLEISRGVGIPGYLKSEAYCPEAVTCIVMTQWPAQLGGVDGVQLPAVSEEIVPPISHPQVAKLVTVSVLEFRPLELPPPAKSSWAAVAISGLLVPVLVTLCAP